jgi:anti-sigma B factor antagonist
VPPQPLPTDSPSVPPLSVTVDLPTARVHVTGELDRTSAHHLVDALDVLTTRSSRRWRLDTSGVTFCDVGGLRALSSAHTFAEAHGRDLRLVSTSRPVERLVELLGHDRVFPAADERRRKPPTTRRPVAGRSPRLRCGTTGTA